MYKQTFWSAINEDFQNLGSCISYFNVFLAFVRDPPANISSRCLVMYFLGEEDLSGVPAIPTHPSLVQLHSTSPRSKKPHYRLCFLDLALESGLYDQTREVGAVCPFTLASVLPWGEVEEKPRGRHLANLVQSEGSWRDGSKKTTAATTSVTKVPRPLVSSGLRNSVRRGHDWGLNPL